MHCMTHAAHSPQGHVLGRGSPGRLLTKLPFAMAAAGSPTCLFLSKQAFSLTQVVLPARLVPPLKPMPLHAEACALM